MRAVSFSVGFVAVHVHHLDQHFILGECTDFLLTDVSVTDRQQDGRLD